MLAKTSVCLQKFATTFTSLHRH